MPAAGECRKQDRALIIVKKGSKLRSQKFSK